MCWRAMLSEHYFVLEAPLPYVAPDMDAIRADMDARQRRADAEMDR